MKHIFTLLFIAIIGNANVFSQTASCIDQSIVLDAVGSSSITPEDVYDGEVAQNIILSLSQENFSCQDVGVNMVTLTVTNIMNGNASTCNATVIVSDNTAPTVFCNDVQNWNVADELSADDIATYSDNCEITQTLVLPSTFSQPGSYSVSLIAFDTGGSASTCISLVDVVGTGSDNEAPVITQCASSQPVESDEMCEYVLEDFTSQIVATDNVTAATNLVVTQSPAPGTILNGGTQQVVTFSVTDEAGISATCNFLLYVVDHINPTIVNCPLDQSAVYTSNYTFPDFGTEIGAYDNCTDNFALNIYQAPGIGVHPTFAANYDITLQVSDEYGNTTTCSFVLDLQNASGSQAICQDVDVMLDAEGLVTITADMVDNGSTGAVTVDMTDFNCSNIGPNVVTLTSTDSQGQSSSCTSTVTVMDTIAPIANCSDFTGVLDATGILLVDASDIDNNSNDNCTVTSMTLSQDTFSSANLGSNTVTLEVMDDSGNTSTCNAIVIVNDPPVEGGLVCNDLSVSLDPLGMATILVSDVATTTVGDGTMILSQDSFYCSNVGANPVTITVTDSQGNNTTCTALVTVMDVIPPTVACQDMVVSLDESGSALIEPSEVISVSFDECGSASITLDQNTFDCSDMGEQVVTVTATDNSGNLANCTATVTVMDGIGPIALCQDVQLNLDENGMAVLTAMDLNNGSVDNCYIATMMSSQVEFNQEDLGMNNVELTVVDGAGNSSSCTSVVTINQGVPSLICPDNMTLDGNESCVVVLPDFADQCVANNFCVSGSLEYTQVPAIGAEISSPTTISMTVLDSCDNSQTCTFNITTNGMEVVISQSEGTLSTNIIADNYQWSYCGGNVITGENESTFTPTESGSYSLTVIANSCLGISDCVDVTVVGIEDAGSLDPFSLYPNPNNGQFTVDLGSIHDNNITLSVINEVGQQVYSENIGDNATVRLDLEHLSSGLYVLQLSSDIRNTKRHFIIE